MLWKKAINANIEEKQGSIVACSVPHLMEWKTKMEYICKDDFEVKVTFIMMLIKQELVFMEMVKEKSYRIKYM